MDNTHVEGEVFARLAESTGNDPAFIGDLIDVYLQDSRKLLGEISAALSAANAPALRRAAHTLKSSSLSLGANGLASLSRDIEERARTGEIPAGASALAALETEWAHVKAELERRRP